VLCGNLAGRGEERVRRVVESEARTAQEGSEEGAGTAGEGRVTGHQEAIETRSRESIQEVRRSYHAVLF